MALIDAQGRYYQVLEVRMLAQINRSRVKLRIWENEAHKIAGETEFKPAQYTMILLNTFHTELAKTADGTKTILDNLKTAGYNALKAEPVFSDMTDG